MFRRSKWSEMSSVSPSSAKPIGTTRLRRPSSGRGRTSCGRIHAAHASSSVAAGQPASNTEPACHVPVALPIR
jgi:hypothetical protein